MTSNQPANQNPYNSAYSQSPNVNTSYQQPAYSNQMYGASYPGYQPQPAGHVAARGEDEAAGCILLGVAFSCVDDVTVALQGC